MDDSQRCAAGGTRLLRSLTVLVGAVLVGVSFLIDGVFNSGFGKSRALLLLAGLAVAISAALSAEWNRRLLLATAATTFSLVTAEGVLRAFFGASYATNLEPHPRYLHRLIPGSRKYFRHLPVNGGHTISVEINRLGFRGPDLEPPGRARRVVVYGDSFIEGEFSAIERTFTAVLGRRLTSGLGIPVEAVNAGVVGYGPDQASLRLEDDLPRLAPHMVIMAVFAHNDFGDLLRNKIFMMDEAGELRSRNPILSDELHQLFRYARYAPVLHKAYTRLGDHGPQQEVAPHEVMEMLLRRRVGEYEEAIRPGPAVTRDLFKDSYDADLSLQPALPSSRYKARLMGAVLRRVKVTAKGAGVPLLLLVIPSPLDVCDHCDSKSGHFRDWTRYPEYRPSAKTDILRETAELNGIPVVDLWPTYRKHGANRLYFNGVENHWNDAGQDLAAALVTERVLSLGLLK